MKVMKAIKVMMVMKVDMDMKGYGGHANDVYRDRPYTLWTSSMLYRLLLSQYSKSCLATQYHQHHVIYHYAPKSLKVPDNFILSGLKGESISMVLALL